MKIRFKKETHLDMWDYEDELSPERFSVDRVMECQLVENNSGELTVTFYNGGYTAVIPEGDIIIVE